VGLAQALVHDPDVIILDEPTVGLDPKQIIEVRNLIKGLAGNHTIILSTHILPEVSMTCDRVVIINKGKIAAVDTPQNLTSQLKGGQKIRIELEAPERGCANCWAKFREPAVRSRIGARQWASERRPSKRRRGMISAARSLRESSKKDGLFMNFTA
jgi:ABC-type multidrug transport system ATPase subunit